MKKTPYAKLIRQKKTKAAFLCALIISLIAFLKGSGYFTIAIFPVSFFVLAFLAFSYRKITDRKKWLAKHASFVNHHGVYDLLFIGDSLTAQWNKEVWTNEFAACKTANFGINGDYAHHVLWRLQNGELKNIQPKVIVLLCGANNIGLAETADQIAATIRQILTTIFENRPEAIILLLGIFPINEKATDPKRKKIQEVNQVLRLLHNGKNVFFLDIGERFLESNGSISKRIMPDYLHLSKEGYSIFADAIRDEIRELIRLQEKQVLKEV